MPKCCVRCTNFDTCKEKGECCDLCDFYEDGECIRQYVGINYKKKSDQSYGQRDDYGDFEEADF